ncbi:MAG TPA: hypothetical protein VE439_11385 [Anaerolineae bacterium]|nr:hypothetical protein [Anaerolineae bacterium]
MKDSTALPHHPTGVHIEEVDGVKANGCPTVLRRPGHAAVRRVQDSVTHRPAGGGVYEVDGVKVPIGPTVLPRPGANCHQLSSCGKYEDEQKDTKKS